MRLRRDCAEAKEALSYDIDVAIPVALPSLHTRVRLTRAEFEVLIAPAVAETVETLERTLDSADVSADSLRSIVLAGGSARIPLVAERLSARFRCPLVLDASPEHSIAVGAALATGLEPAAGPALPPDSATPAEAPPTEPGPAVIGKPGGRSVPVLPRRGRRSALALGAVACLAVAGLVIWLALGGGGGRGGAGARPETSVPPLEGPIAASASWERKADLPVALEGAAVAAYQGKVWVAGGLANDESRTKLSTVFVYDPDSDTWSTGPSLPRPVSHASLVATPSTLYLLGGWLQDGFGSAQSLKLNSTNTAWVQDVPLPATRVAGAAAFDGRWVIYGGGTAKGGVASDTVWALRGARWDSIGRLGQKRQKLAAVSNNVDTIWLLGGRDQETGERFGTIDRVSQGQVAPAANGQQAPITPPVDSAAAVRLDGVGMCLVGGEATGRGYNDWWCDQSGAAEKLPKLDPQRAGLGAARIGQTVYVVGGYGRTFQGSTLVEAFTPPPG